MPYTSLDQVNPSIKGIKPPVTLEQANAIAAAADAISASDKPPDSPWAVAIVNFKQTHTVSGDGWVKKETKRGEAVMKTNDDQPILSEAPLADATNSGPPNAPSSAPPAPKAVQPTADSVRVEMIPLVKFDPVTLELVDVDPAQGIQAVVGLPTKHGDDDPKIVQTYVFTGDAWADASASKWVKNKGAKKGEPWDKPAEPDKPPEGDSPPEGDKPPDTPQERHYGQPRKHERTLAEIKQLKKKVEQLLKEIDGTGPAPDAALLPGEEAGQGDQMGALQALWDDFTAGVAEVLGLNGAEKPVPEAALPEIGVATEAAEAKIAESVDGAGLHVELDEAMLAEGDGNPKPLNMKIEIIQPGWGNLKDNHFYPADMLRAHAERFVGAKMYESDHGLNKSTREWVSTITDILGFSDRGAPVARVVVHDPGFAERARNLAQAGLLNKLECSILADGKAVAGFEEGGRKGKRVESITEVESVDWVTRAGAGGHAAELAEAQKGASLTPELVEQQIKASKLPVASQARLAEGQYPNVEALQTAIVAEREYVKVLTGSGQPFGSPPAAPAPVLSEAERLKAKDAVLAKHLG